MVFTLWQRYHCVLKHCLAASFAHTNMKSHDKWHFKSETNCNWCVFAVLFALPIDERLLIMAMISPRLIAKRNQMFSVQSLRNAICQRFAMLVWWTASSSGKFDNQVVAIHFIAQISFDQKHTCSLTSNEVRLFANTSSMSTLERMNIEWRLKTVVSRLRVCDCTALIRCHQFTYRKFYFYSLEC